MLKPMAILLPLLLVLIGCSFDDASETDLLVLAAMSCDIDEVERLVSEEGFDPSEPGYLASALLAWGPRTAGASHEECLSTIEFFLDSGADPVLVGGVPSAVLAGDNLPQVLDLFDPSVENWCVSNRSDKPLKRIAIEDAGWSESDVDTYLGQCPG